VARGQQHECDGGGSEEEARGGGEGEGFAEDEGSEDGGCRRHQEEQRVEACDAEVAEERPVEGVGQEAGDEGREGGRGPEAWRGRRS
jgi:hypothetical protein